MAKTDYVFGRYARAGKCCRPGCGQRAEQYYYLVGNSTSKRPLCDAHVELAKAIMQELGKTFKQAESDAQSRADSWRNIRRHNPIWRNIHSTEY